MAQFVKTAKNLLGKGTRINNGSKDNISSLLQVLCVRHCKHLESLIS